MLISIFETIKHKEIEKSMANDNYLIERVKKYDLSDCIIHKKLFSTLLYIEIGIYDVRQVYDKKYVISELTKHFKEKYTDFHHLNLQRAREYGYVSVTIYF